MWLFRRRCGVLLLLVLFALTSGTVTSGTTRTLGTFRAASDPGTLASVLQLAQSGGGRVLRVAAATSAMGFQSMDPHARTGAEIAYFENMMEPLVSFDAEKGTVTPLLAESWSNTDGTVWTLKLRRNVKFHDGGLFKADAVQYALERINAIKQSPAFSLLQDKVKSFKVIDDYTVQFTVNKSGPSFLQLLTMVLVVSPTAGKKNDQRDVAQAYFRDNPIGTGPYKLSRWDKGSLQVLVRNPDYWRGWDGEHYTGVIYEIIPEANTQQLLLERGDLDIAMTVPSESLPALKKNPEITVQEEPGIRTWIMRMNMVAGPTQDVRVRKALAQAFDYDAYLKAQAGNVSLPTGPIPKPMMGGWVPENLPKHDLDRAKALLTEVGIAPGTAFHVLVAREVVTVQGPATEILQANLRKIGYDVKIDVRSASVWFQEIVNWIEKENSDPAKAPSNIFHLLVPPRLPDPWAYLWFNYHSEAIRGAGRNWYQYRVPAIDNLIDRSSEQTDNTRRLETFKQAVRRIVDDQPDIWFANDVRIYVRRKSVGGFQVHPVWAEGVHFYPLKPGN